MRNHSYYPCCRLHLFHPLVMHTSNQAARAAPHLPSQSSDTLCDFKQNLPGCWGKKKKPTSEIPVWVPSVILQLLSSICFLPLPHSSVAFVKSPPKKREGFESSQQKKGSWNITEVTRHPTYCLCQNRFVFLTLQLQQDVHFLSLLQLLLHSLAKEERHHKSHISVDGF